MIETKEFKQFLKRETDYFKVLDTYEIKNNVVYIDVLKKNDNRLRQIRWSIKDNSHIGFAMGYKNDY